MLYHRHLNKKTRKFEGPPLLIYQMGKVGSKTIRSSLKASNLDMPIFLVHFLSQDRVREMEIERLKYLGTSKETLLRHIWRYMYLNDRIAGGMDGERWKIITLTREPISRNLSTFFENLEIESLDNEKRYRVQSDYYDFDLSLDLDNLDELTAMFFNRLHHERPLKFFDDEIKRVFGMDVYSSDFPMDSGYKIYAADSVDVLLIRLEDLNSCVHEAIRDFLWITDLDIVNSNVGKDKPNAALYDVFKRSMVFPRSYVDKMYDSKYARHFYSSEEIAAFRSRWHISDS